jgi:hypothetical protein
MTGLGTEWAGMLRLFGDKVLAELLLIPPSNVARYASGGHLTPSEMADRLHVIATAGVPVNQRVRLRRLAHRRRR